MGDSLNTIKLMKPVSIIILLLALISASLPAQTVSRSTLDQIILPEVAFNELELSNVAYVLSSFSRIYSDERREIKIRVQPSSGGELYDITVTYSAKNISLRRVIEDIAAQTNSEVKYLPDSSVVFTDPPKRLTLEQKAKQVRELNPNWNTHLSDPELLMAYLRYHPHEITTFNAPASMKSRLEVQVQEDITRKAKVQEDIARKAKVQEEARRAKQQQEEARRAIFYNTQYGRTSNNQSAPRVKTNPSSVSDDDDIIGLMIAIVIGAIIWGVAALGQRNNTEVTPPKLPQKSTAQKAPSKKTPTAQKGSAAKSPTKKATTKKKVPSKSTTETASGSHINDDSLNPENGGGIEAQIACLQQLFDRGRISEEEMDQKIRKLLTGSS